MIIISSSSSVVLMMMAYEDDSGGSRTTSADLGERPGDEHVYEMHRRFQNVSPGPPLPRLRPCKSPARLIE